MLRCINCTLCVQRLQRYAASTLPLRWQGILLEWLALQELTADAVICHACYILLNNSSIDDPRPTRRLGHTDVCIGCGRSLTRLRHHILNENHLLLNVFQWNITMPEHSNRVCQTCWLRGNRRLLQDQQRMAILLPAEQPEENRPLVAPAAIPLPPEQPEENRPLVAPAAIPLPPEQPEENRPLVAPAVIPLPPEQPEENRPLVEPDVIPLPPEQPEENLPLAAPAIEERPHPAMITLPNYSRAPNSSRHCIYNACRNVAGYLVPTFIKVYLVKEYKYYVPRSARVCEMHLNRNDWQRLPEINIQRSISEFTGAHVEDLIDLAKRDISFNFENVHEMPNHICHYWTGLTVLEFTALYNELMLGNYITSPKTSLAIYLTKLRTGDSGKRLSSLFQMPRTTLEQHIKKVREYLVEHFIPLHLGLQHMTRQDVATRNLMVPNALFGRPDSSLEERPAIVICDGTYIYIEKSSNYLYQKKTYSLHKYDNLVKPFLIVCCDGYILDATGPYAATETDANIMSDLFRDANRPMRNFFRENDIFILDRGFRDAIPLLEDCNYKVFKPESLDQGETQLSTLQANKSRCVTLCRWVVEVVNGRFKRDFKIFRQDFFNTAHRHLMDDFKVAAALINRFHPFITDRPDAQLIINRALRYLEAPNHLATYVIENNLNRRRVLFLNVDGNLPQLDTFPRLSLEELVLISLGPYQIKQARSYYGEHVRRNGIYQIQVCPQLERCEEMVAQVGGTRPCLLRARISSRHITQKQYFTYILFETDISNRCPIDLILGYYCSCIVGNRTVGCCCHVMTIIWFLGWARYEENVAAPAAYLDNILIVMED